MRAHSFMRVTVNLDDGDEWRERNEAGLVFEVRRVQWAEGPHANLSGPAVLKNGDLGSIHRTKRVRFIDLPLTVAEAIRDEARRDR